MKAPIAKFVKIVLLILAVIALACGGIAGMHYYQYRQGAEFAFGKLRAALTPPDLEALAKHVDFQTISRQLAVETARVFPFFRQGPDQVYDLQTLFQTVLLKRLKTKEEPAKEKQNADSREMLFRPLTVLPEDFMGQFVAGLAMHSAENDTALLTTSVSHPLLKRKFPIILSMVKDSRGWIVRDLLNAGDIVTAFYDAMVNRLNERQELLLNQQKAILKRMGETLPIQSCTASAGLLSDGKTLIVAVRILARNTSNTGVQNVDADISVRDAQGAELLQRYLNAVQPTAPGDNFDRNWNIELDGLNELGQKILNAGGLSCQAAWRTLTLSTGQILHTEDLPETLANCGEPGHQHPDGLCKSAIFAIQNELSPSKKKEAAPDKNAK